MLRILWLDNDSAQTVPYVNALKRCEHNVTQVKTISDFERNLNEQGPYDLVILDVMVPTKDDAEEARYQPDQTDRGNMTGLEIWRRWKGHFEETNTRVLALTVRLDRGIGERFLDAGFPIECFANKLDLRDTLDFLKRIEQVTKHSGKEKA